MPWDYEETIRIDADDILDYVKDNKDWFLEQLGESKDQVKTEVAEAIRKVENFINENDSVRRLRDADPKNKELPECKIYDTLLNIKSILEDIIK
jgi:asparagine synthetase A